MCRVKKKRFTRLIFVFIFSGIVAPQTTRKRLYTRYSSSIVVSMMYFINYGTDPSKKIFPTARAKLPNLAHESQNL